MQWKNTILNNPFLRRIKHSDGTTEDVEISNIPENVIEQGTALSEANLNQNNEDIKAEIKTEETGIITLAEGFNSPSNYLKKKEGWAECYALINGKAIPAKTVTRLCILSYLPVGVFVDDAKIDGGFNANVGTIQVGEVRVNADGSVDFIASNAVTASQNIRLKLEYMVKE